MSSLWSLLHAEGGTAAPSTHTYRRETIRLSSLSVQGVPEILHHGPSQLVPWKWLGIGCSQSSIPRIEKSWHSICKHFNRLLSGALDPAPHGGILCLVYLLYFSHLLGKTRRNGHAMTQICHVHPNWNLYPFHCFYLVTPSQNILPL